MMQCKNQAAHFAIQKQSVVHAMQSHMHIMQYKNPYAQYVMQKPNQHSAMAGLLCGSAVEQHYPGVSANHCALP